MPLDPQTAELLAAFAAAGTPPARTLTPEQNREQYARVVAARKGDGYRPEPVGDSEALVLPGPAGPLPCRLHRPEGVERPPVLAFFHGGGWVVGGLESHDAVTRALCRRAGIAVLAVDYRLAPEHRYPAAFHDCLAATRHLVAAAGELGLGPVGVGGDSAGGNLAAAVALACRDEGAPLAAQLLVYPAVDAAASSPSYDENATGYYLEAADMRWYWEQYAGPVDRRDPLLSPAAADELAGLPRAVVATAEYDPLRDEGDAYAERLRAAGVPVWWRCYPGLVHGFLGSGGAVAAADRAVTEIAEEVGRALRGR